MKAIKWKNDSLDLLDQTLLPNQVKTINCRTCDDVAHAIKSMKVRGAPAIGVTAAYGIVLTAKNNESKEIDIVKEKLEAGKEILAATRPTAVNLFWALERMERVWNNTNHSNTKKLIEELENEAMAIEKEDIDMNKNIGLYGSELIPNKANILTHCNAGALATAGYGTALGVIRYASFEKKDIHVYADETRPLLQGARLTAWELMEDNIPVTLVTDNMAGYLMQQGKVDLIIVGADRITAYGDVANKIGTYSLAVLAKYHGIPIYVAAPVSTIDMNINIGTEIDIEERHHDEVRLLGGIETAPKNVNVYNPAFDVTPASLITAIITNKGVLKPPYAGSIKKLFNE